MTKFTNAVFGAASLAVLQFAAAPSFTAQIIFDQQGDQSFVRSGVVEYDGSGGPLRGSDIRFNQVTYERDDGTSQSLNCNDCFLNFVTGNNVRQIDLDDEVDGVDNWAWAATGDPSSNAFTVRGTVDGANSTIDGTGQQQPLLQGFFTSKINAQKQYDSVSDQFTLFINASGSDFKNPLLLEEFGLDPTTPFTFASTAISLAQSEFFGENGEGFRPRGDSNVTNADVNNTPRPNQQPPTAVPEPSEAGMFLIGLGFVLIGLLYRRRENEML